MHNTQTTAIRPSQLVSSWIAIPTWFWIGLLAALVVRLLVAWSPVETSFALALPDDAYYYFTIARNIAGGAGVTFDGLSPTNGFHPLWMVLIVPIWWLVGDSQSLPVHLALTVSALLGATAILGIWTLLYQLTGSSKFAALGGLFFAFNPYVIMASVNGMETSVATLLFVASLYAYWRLRSSSQPTWQNSLVLGLLWALLVLARTDYVLILFPCLLDLLWRHRSSLLVLSTAALGVLLWLPWIAWNIITFGNFEQVSGDAYPYYLHLIWEAEGHTLSQYLLQQLKMFYGVSANVAVHSGLNKLIIFLLPGAAFLVFNAWNNRATKTQADDGLVDWFALKGLLWPTIGAIILLLVHALIRWMYLPWYYLPALVLLVLWLTASLYWLDLRRKNWGLALAIALVAYQFLLGIQLYQRGGYYVGQARTVARRMPELLEACQQHELLGISDAGYYGYYLPCRVVNLDGVVNNRAFAAIHQGYFREYLDQTSIEFVLINGIVRGAVSVKEGSIPESPPYASD